MGGQGKAITSWRKHSTRKLWRCQHPVSSAPVCRVFLSAVTPKWSCMVNICLNCYLWHWNFYQFFFIQLRKTSCAKMSHNLFRNIPHCFWFFNLSSSYYPIKNHYLFSISLHTCTKKNFQCNQLHSVSVNSTLLLNSNLPTYSLIQQTYTDHFPYARHWRNKLRAGWNLSFHNMVSYSDSGMLWILNKIVFLPISICISASFPFMFGTPQT